MIELRSLTGFISIVAVLSTLTAFADDESSTAASAEQVRFFESRIRPMLAEHCYSCHGEDLQENDLRVDSLAGMLNGGKAGPALVAGKPAQSLLATAVTYRDNDLKMPPEQKLDDRDIADLKRWIESGAPHPDSGKIKVNGPKSSIDFQAGRQHWAFQPVVRPDVPAIARNPVDAFIRQDLSEHGIHPLSRADKRTLIRRATFDLTGLPPTVEEINAFLSDNSEQAFNKVVDRLLDSPRYGERWGRYWLDVARYADSNGLDENAAHANAWRYRDYVVQSFNDDKPYDVFLTEQLAGDLLNTLDADGKTDRDVQHQRIIATGYLVLGPKVLAEVDEGKMEMDIVDEQLDTFGRGIIGITMGCTRCHDHKFDPFEQADYYGLAGIFQSTRAMESFTKIAKWNEVSVATADDIARKEAHQKLIDAQKQAIEEHLTSAARELDPPLPDAKPEEIEKKLPEAAAAKLKKLRDDLKKLEDDAPQMPMAMAVVDGDVVNTPIHIRGSHLTLGDPVSRRFPKVLTGDEQSTLSEDRSGRLELARWLTNGDHPLTSRVMVNRIWRWHFGKGIVPTVDNFGLQGERPTHPELLDWLAAEFVESGWSMKAMHRLVMASETYQMASANADADQMQAASAADPENRYYWRADVRRLEAEAIRDTVLAVSGTLDLTMGGSLMETPNRQLVFNHTSQDASNYDARRRSIYLPVIRNHLYDMFQLFDYTDASVLTGGRNTSTIAPQALFLMNSDFISDVTLEMADRLIAAEPEIAARVNRLFAECYGRPPSSAEMSFVSTFLEQVPASDTSAKSLDESAVWQALCQSVISSSEFVYVR